MRCPGCGAEASGNFCSRCGSGLATPDRCPGCQARLADGVLYCSGCGRPVAGPPKKSLSTRMPWILSAAALAAFALAISLFVQNQSSPRPIGGTMTGGIPEPQAPPGGESAMPSAVDLSAMSPRQAADRLFDRAMREGEAGNDEQARFFANMGLEAYGGVTGPDLDADARFHMGLLAVALEDYDRADREAEALLGEEPRDLFGLLLLVRVAEGRDRPEERAQHLAALRDAVESGVSPAAPRFASHANMIERAIGRGGG